MRGYWLWVLVALTVVLLGIGGCSSGGDAPQPLTIDELLSRGQAELESVTTNPTMNPEDAGTALRAAVRDFSAVLEKDAQNIRAKWGFALANTFLGFYDLTEVLPGGLDQLVLNILTQSRAPLPIPDARRQSRASDMQDVQLRILSRTLSGLTTEALPMFDTVESAVRGGTQVSTRMYQQGQIKTIVFGVADVQIVAAFSNLVASLLYLSVSYNLDMPGNTPVRPLPVDSNNNGMFDAEEYLISAPFLERLYAQGMPNFLQYLRYAAIKAQQGASLNGHTSGTNALIDTSDPEMRQTLNQLATYAAGLSVACTTEVSTNQFFGDGVTRTLNLPKLANITSMRGLLPSFQKDNLNAPGVWPDPTFRGAITPGMPQGYFTLTYDQIVNAF